MCTCYGQKPSRYKFFKGREEKDAVGMPASTLVRTADTAGISITKTKGGDALLVGLVVLFDI